MVDQNTLNKVIGLVTENRTISADLAEAVGLLRESLESYEYCLNNKWDEPTCGACYPCRVAAFLSRMDKTNEQEL